MARRSSPSRGPRGGPTPPTWRRGWWASTSGAPRAAPTSSRTERRALLAPPSDEPALLFLHVGPECLAGGAEAVPDPGVIVPAREPRVGVVEPERDRFQPVSVELDEEEQAEVVPQLRVH